MNKLRAFKDNTVLNENSEQDLTRLNSGFRILNHLLQFLDWNKGKVGYLSKLGN